jgi:hypothetical protein
VVEESDSWILGYATLTAINRHIHGIIRTLRTCRTEPSIYHCHASFNDLNHERPS